MNDMKQVFDNPLTILIQLPDGCTPGRWEAVEAFAQSVADLKNLHPDKNFQLLPFTFDDGNLSSMLAISLTPYVAQLQGNKLEAIRKIAFADGVINSSKLKGIMEVLDSEFNPEVIAEVFSKSRKQATAEAETRMGKRNKNE